MCVLWVVGHGRGMKLPKPVLGVPQPAAFYIHAVASRVAVVFAANGHVFVSAPAWELELTGEDAMISTTIDAEFPVSVERVVAVLQHWDFTPAQTFLATPVMLGLTVGEYELALVMAPTWAGTWEELSETVKIISA